MNEEAFDDSLNIKLIEVNSRFSFYLLSFGVGVVSILLLISLAFVIRIDDKLSRIEKQIVKVEAEKK